jgi:hypothetical protein
MNVEMKRTKKRVGYLAVLMVSGVLASCDGNSQETVSQPASDGVAGSERYGPDTTGVTEEEAAYLQQLNNRAARKQDQHNSSKDATAGKSGPVIIDGDYLEGVWCYTEMTQTAPAMTTYPNLTFVFNRDFSVRASPKPGEEPSQKGDWSVTANRIMFLTHTPVKTETSRIKQADADNFTLRGVLQTHHFTRGSCSQ